MELKWEIIDVSLWYRQSHLYIMFECTVFFLYCTSWYFHTHSNNSFFLSSVFFLPIPITLFWLFQSIPVPLSGPVSSFADLMVRKAATHCYHFLRRSFTILFTLPLCAVADIVSSFCDKNKKYLNIFFLVI